MIEVGIAGCLGRMGTAIVEAVGAEPDMHIACGIDPHPTTKAEDQAFPLYESIEDAVESQRIDVLVDFTRPSVVEHTLEVALSHDIDCVVGTTGVSAERLREIYEASGTDACLFFAPNFTIGAVLMMQFAKMSAKYFPEAEVIEMHHCNKLDAPSGTAVQTTALICEGREGASSQAPGKETEVEGAEGARGALINGVPVHSVRSMGFVADQEVIFGSLGQTLTITHRSWDRSSYMPGVLLAIRKVQGGSGLIIGLEHFLDI